MTSEFESELTEQLAELGGKVKQSREFRRLTLHACARQADIGVQTLIRIEKGNTGVSVLNLHKVLRVLGVNQSLVPLSMPFGSQDVGPAPPVSSKEAVMALDAAAQAACVVLNQWLARTPSPRVAVGPDFKSQLQSHLEAMLTGAPNSDRTAAL